MAKLVVFPQPQYIYYILICLLNIVDWFLTILVDNMDLTGKQDVDVEIKSTAEEFYNVLKSKIQHLPNISSDKVHGVEVQEGDWEASGSVKLWKFTVGKALLIHYLKLVLELTFFVINS